MKIVTAAEMREIDRVTSERHGVPSLTLMENAGAAVAEFVLGRYPQANRIGIVCGRGNNGGDGFVAARKLREAGRAVTVILLADPSELKGDAAEMFQRMGHSPLVIKSVGEFRSEAARKALAGDILIDAILGTGFRPPVTELYADAIHALNATGLPVVAVDIPSGADADAMAPPAEKDLVARADAVVTFTAPRPAHIFANLTAGPIVCSRIGSPDQAIASQLKLEVVTAGDVARFAERRDPEAHKGSFGHVLVVGGSTGKAGAAAMAGMAALRSGAGLVTVATAKSVLPTVAGFAPEIMTEPLAETETGAISMRALEYGRFDALVEGKTVIALGPGFSRHTEAAQFARSVFDLHYLPLVIDADGLNAFEGCPAKLDGHRRPLVLTPHPGEMARLTGLSTRDIQKDRVAIARKFALERHAIVVLKGHRTVIAQPDGPTWINPTGNPGMASGGTGDVLTGMISGFIAQNPKDILGAVLAGVFLHGLGGDIARNLVGEQSLVATDILAMLPLAFDRVRQRAKEKFVLISE
ncbi:MAG: NAD(P)H-hydrate dehydratase [Acidobacteriia bacterium]|nr:NAD(P)H-hydrate dehydratase [Terriglobia bacterium]